jgi:uncharacterized membrane protein
MFIWALAGQSGYVEAASKGYGAKFFAFWIIVVVILVVVIGIPVMTVRKRRQRNE